MKASSIRRKLREMNVPAHRIEWAAEKFGDRDIPTPEAQKLVEREARKARQATERKLFRLWCRHNELPAPAFEFYFAKPERAYRFDIAWEPEKVAVEINGGIWRKGGGAHTGTGHIRDMKKLTLAQKLGWRVAQYTPEQVRTPAMLNDLRSLLSEAA